MGSLLKEENQDNVGSIVSINFIDVNDVELLPDAIGLDLLEPVLLKDGKSWSMIEVTQETPGFDIDDNTSQAGNGKSIAVKGFIAGHNSGLESRMQQMREQRFLVMITDFEGRKRLLGTIANPIRFKWSFGTGTKTSGRKGYELQFYQLAGRTPLYYQSPFDVTPDPGGDPVDPDSYLAQLIARVEDLEDVSHTQNTDTKLAQGTSNEVTAAEIKSLLASFLKVFYKDGSVPAEGNFNLNGYDINGVRNIFDNYAQKVLDLQNRYFYDGYGQLAIKLFSRTYGIQITSNGNFAKILTDNLNGDRSIQFQDKDYTGVADITDVNNATNYLLDGVPSGGDTLNKLYNLIVGIGQFVGGFDASSGALPTTGSGASGAIDKGDYWVISVAGTISGVGVLKAGDSIFAKVNNASTSGDFFALENNQDQATSSTLGLVKLYADLLSSNTDGAVSQAVVKAVIDTIIPKLDPSIPSNDGYEYYESVNDGDKSWIKIVDANGTSIGNKNKLQAGAIGDWVNGSYVGAVSGVTTGTLGGERFTGQDATDSLYYRYECITDNNWIRTKLA